MAFANEPGLPLHLTMGKWGNGARDFHQLRIDNYLEKPEAERAVSGAGELRFADLLDVVNPLQHIPVVSTLYREWTGDEIGQSARVAGGALYGGVVGAVSSLANVLIEEATGRDVGSHALAVLGLGRDGDEAPKESALALAATAPAETVLSLPEEDVPAAPEEPETNAPTVAASAVEPPRLSAQGLPALSPEAFDALLRSFSGPVALERPAGAAGDDGPVKGTG